MSQVSLCAKERHSNFLMRPHKVAVMFSGSSSILLPTVNLDELILEINLSGEVISATAVKHSLIISPSANGFFWLKFE